MIFNFLSPLHSVFFWLWSSSPSELQLLHGFSLQSLSLSSDLWLSLSFLPPEADCKFTEQDWTSERERYELIWNLPSFTLNSPTPFKSNFFFFCLLFLLPSLYVCFICLRGRRWLVKQIKSIISWLSWKKQFSLPSEWNLLSYEKRLNKLAWTITRIARISVSIIDLWHTFLCCI